ncbi:MAG: ABC transporter permease [Firmicutes bacterium]|nr:ABC transporter permease [Bacillota bacterium]
MVRAIKDLFRHDKKFRFGFSIMVFFIIISFVSLFSPYDLSTWNVVPRDLSPSLKYPLGTNSMGQDIFWKATAAVKNSLLLGLIAALVSRIIAIILGLLAGYMGGTVDRVIMTITDSFIIIPLFPLLILVSSILRASLDIFVLGIILGLFGWANDARLLRSQILSIREREFTKTAVLSGMKPTRIIIKEHLPHIIPLIMATVINNIVWVIGMEVTLSVLGLSSLNTPTIGTMIYWAQQYQAVFLEMWHWILTPIVICVVLIISLYFISTSISTYLDPRTRVRMIKGE